MSKKGNFTVKAQALKNGVSGLTDYASYLQSNKPKSHANTEILNLFPNHPNYKEFCNKTTMNILGVQENNTKALNQEPDQELVAFKRLRLFQ
jgi:hypothetical protein